LNFSSSRPCRTHQVPNWDLETDVIVVSFGATGACAAIEAASSHGGTSALSGGEIYLGGSGGAPVQRQAGFSDDTEDLFRYLMMAGGAEADESKVRLYEENSLGHYEWVRQ
jgi:succinate dehydrogenase/fumarate reductase flavoprotein subunit